PEIARAVGCSPAAVRKSAAWKAVSRRRKANKKVTVRAGDCPEWRKEEALDKAAIERSEQADGAGCLPDDGGRDEEEEAPDTATTEQYEQADEEGGHRPGKEELAELIKQHKRDEASERRRPRRKRNA